LNILITGAKGFIGKNLTVELRNRQYSAVFEYDQETDDELLDKYTKEADFVFHLAGVNRPHNNEEFMESNFGFASILLSLLKKHNNTCPILVSSSTQAELENPYGQSKKASEDLFLSYAAATGAVVYIYRLPNVFRKWCRPNYNSAVATFCNNIACNLPITVNDPSVILKLAYIDNVMKEFMNCLQGKANKLRNGLCTVPVVYSITLGKIVDLLYSFRASRNKLDIPDMSDGFTKKLYATYLSYLPKDHFNYTLKMNCDDRGSFTEMLRTSERGQFSVNVSKPGIEKGNHYHHTKNEKFVVVSGHGVIRLRKLDSDDVIEYNVSGDKMEVVDIPPGYTHSIKNSGETDLVTFMWCSECFDPNNPDTYHFEVDNE